MGESLKPDERPRPRGDTQTLLAVERTFRLIDENFQETLSNTPDDQDRHRIVSVRDAARDAYWKAVESHLGNDSVPVQRLREDLKTANQTLEASLADRANPAELLLNLTQATKLATSLTALAST